MGRPAEYSACTNRAVTMSDACNRGIFLPPSAKVGSDHIGSPSRHVCCGLLFAVCPPSANDPCGAVRECRAQLLELAARVFDTQRPVAARGVVLLERMLERGALYGNGRAAKLRREVSAARDALPASSC